MFYDSTKETQHPDVFCNVSLCMCWFYVFIIRL